MKTIKQSVLNAFESTAGHRPTGVQTTTIRNLSLCGTIRLVEPSREMLFLHLPKDDQEQIIHWQPRTRFLYCGAKAKADVLRQGQRISVEFSDDAGQKFAKEIDIGVEPSVVVSTDAQRRALWPRRSVKRIPK